MKKSYSGNYNQSPVFVMIITSLRHSGFMGKVGFTDISSLRDFIRAYDPLAYDLNYCKLQKRIAVTRAR
ncbi:hypothetical protein [Marinilabilia sp.]